MQSLARSLAILDVVRCKRRVRSVCSSFEQVPAFGEYQMTCCCTSTRVGKGQKLICQSKSIEHETLRRINHGLSLVSPSGHSSDIGIDGTTASVVKDKYTNSAYSSQFGVVAYGKCPSAALYCRAELQLLMFVEFPTTFVHNIICCIAVCRAHCVVVNIQTQVGKLQDEPSSIGGGS